MKHKKRKLIATVTAVFMLMTVCIVPAEFVSADSSSTDVKWTEGITGGAIYFDESTGTITDCDSNVTAAVIPAMINDVPVMTIGSEAFRSCESLTSVTIPNSVTAIREHAFDNCSKLPDVTIPDSVKMIYNSAFRECDSLTSVTIPDSVETIDYMAFYSCDNLPSINIPKGVTTIGDEAFGCCDKLTDITVDKDNENFSSENGVLFNKDKTVLIQYLATKSETSYKIPDSVKSIGYSAFYYCSKLTSVTIPSSVESIAARAFWDCDGLTSVEFPDNLTTIGEESFAYCGRLSDITIPASVASIGDRAFLPCKSLTKITVDKNNEYYSSDEGVLYDKKQEVLMQYPAGNDRTSYAIPNSVKNIEENAFDSCKLLTSVTIPDGVTSIGKYAFISCKSLTGITIPDSVTSIGNDAFQNCKSLTKITVGKNNSKYSSADGVLFDKEQTLLMLYPSGNNREFYEIPNSVKSIDEMAFFYSDFLTSIVIPDSVTSISYDAFSYSELLTVYGYKGSYAEKFATMLGLSFKALPSAPDKLTVNLNEKYDTLKASWNKVAGADGYYVYYKKSTWNSYKKLGSTTKLTYTKDDLTDGAKYAFRVYPYVDIDRQKYMTKNGKSSGYVYTLKKLNKPSVKKSSHSYVKVSWNNIKGESGYEIARSKYSNKKFTIVKRVSYKYKSATIKTPRYKKYYYKVRAYKTVNGKKINGHWSSAKSYKLK